MRNSGANVSRNNTAAWERLFETGQIASRKQDLEVLVFYSRRNKRCPMPFRKSVAPVTA